MHGIRSSHIRELSKIIGYPGRFANRCSTETDYQSRKKTSQEKRSIRYCPVWEDNPLEFLEHHLSKSTGGAMLTTYALIMSKLKPLIGQRSKDPWPHTFQSIVFPQCTCSCGER